MSLYRVLRTSKATLTRVFYLDEVATDATGAVTATITRWDGTNVQGPVTTAGPDADHGYTFTFNGSDTLDNLTLTWVATVGGDAIVLDQDQIEVVGGHLIGLSAIRGIDPKFRDTVRFPTQELIDRRIEVESEFERITGQSFVPRFAVDTLSVPLGATNRPLKLTWPWLREVRSVSVSGASATATYGADPLGLLRNPAMGWPYGTGHIVVEYEHGMDRPPPDITRVAKLRLKSLLLTTQSPLPDRAERIATTEVGLVTLAIARDDATGIPEVDAALGRWPSPRPKFG